MARKLGKRPFDIQSRTERLRAVAQQRQESIQEGRRISTQQQRFETGKQQLTGSTPEQYEQRYQQLAPETKERFIQPTTYRERYTEARQVQVRADPMAEKRQAYEVAKKYISRGKTPIGESQQVKKYWREMKQGREFKFEKPEATITPITPTYITPEGQEVSIAPELAKERGYIQDPASTFDIRGEVERRKEARKEKPFLTVEPAPTFVETWKEAPTTVGFVFEKIKGFGTQIALGKKGKYKFIPFAGEPYQPEPTGEAFKLGAQYGIYTTMASLALISSGAEHLVKPAGREEIKGIGLEWEEKYKIPKETAWVIPAAEIALGAYPYAKKFTREPVITTKEIGLKPRLTTAQQRAQVSQVLKRDIATDIYGKTIIKDVQKFTQMQEQLIAGRRTIVTTRARRFIGAKPIYEGIPYADMKKIYQVSGLRAPTLTYTEGGAYAKALKRLEKYGISTGEAKQALRYYQPKAYVAKTKGVMKVTYGEDVKQLITTRGVRITIPEIRELDKLLGIKTRGGVRSMDVFTGKGFEIGTIGDVSVYRSMIESERMLLTPKGYPYTPVRKLGKVRTTYEQLTGIKGKGEVQVLTLKDIEGLTIGKYAPAELYKEISAYRQVVPARKEIIKRRGEILAYKPTKKPLSIEYDIRDITGIRAEKIIKPPKPKSLKDIAKYTPIDVKDLMKSLERVYGKPIAPTKRVDQILGRRTIISTPPTKQIPIPKRMSIKQMDKLISKQALGIGAIEKSFVGVTGVVATKTLQAQQQKQLQKQLQNLEQLTGLKQIAKPAQALRQKAQQKQQQKQLQKQAQIQKQLQKQQLKQLQISQLQIGYPVPTPPPSVPFEPPFKMPLIIPFDLPEFEDKLLKTKRKKGIGKEYAYAPTFTEKIVGFKPLKVTESQAAKLVRKELTPFQLIRAVKIIK